VADEGSLGDKRSTALVESFFVGSSRLEDGLEGESLQAPLIVSPEVLDEPISRWEEGEEDEFLEESLREFAGFFRITHWILISWHYIRDMTAFTFLTNGSLEEQGEVRP